MRGEIDVRFTGATDTLASAEFDTGIEPSIKDISHQVEENDEAREDKGDRHDDRCVIGENG
jgi:hypothetical protein